LSPELWPVTAAPIIRHRVGYEGWIIEGKVSQRQLAQRKLRSFYRRFTPAPISVSATVLGRLRRRTGAKFVGADGLHPDAIGGRR
jgi:hypothetical protein